MGVQYSYNVQFIHSVNVGEALGRIKKVDVLRIHRLALFTKIGIFYDRNQSRLHFTKDHSCHGGDMKTICYLFIICSGLLSIVTTSNALPKYASRTGYKCQSCHINPTGKGMRTEFGANYGRDDISLPTYKNLTDYDDFTTKLGPSLSFGADYRSMFYYETLDRTSTFFQMQGSFYVDFLLNKKFQVYADKDLFGDVEVFGLAKVLPLDGYVKIGRFVPAYGTKVDDHNYFIRGGPYNPGVQFGGQFPAAYPAGLRFWRAFRRHRT